MQYAQRSAMSGLLQFCDADNFGDHPLVKKKIMKGVFELRPSFPRYASTWNVDVVFDYLELLVPHDKLTLKELTLKLVILIAVLSGQRCQTVANLSLRSMKLTDEKCTFIIDFCVKQTRRGKHLAPVELLAFPDNNALCAVSVLREYLKQRKSIRKDMDKLFIAHQKPHKAVSTDTIGRWIRDGLTRAGIDTVQFGAHSTRAASTSAAVSRGAPVDAVLKAAGWSAESTFTKFYKKAPAANLGQTLLDSYLKAQK